MVTIIVLLILSVVSFRIISSDDGIINKAETAKEENEKAAATETMNLKITNVQIEKYAEEQRMPTLKELADNFCEDRDFEKVIEKTAEAGTVGNLPKISNNNPTAIIAKLKAYPYEFEINSSLQLASIDGVRVASNPPSNVENDYIEISEENAKKIIEYTKNKYVVSTNTLFNDCGYVEKIINSDNSVNYIIENDDILDKAIDSQYMMTSLLKSSKKNDIVSQLLEKSYTNPQLTSTNGNDGGYCFGTAPYNGFGFQIWHGFNENNEYAYNGIGDMNMGYKFNNPIWCFKFSFGQRSASEGIDNLIVQYSDDGNLWTNATNKIITLKNSSDSQEYIIDNSIGKHLYWQIIGNGYGLNGGLRNLKFYGIN